MVEMGWVALTIPEEYDGLGFGYLGFGQILDETGRTLTASPLLSTVGLGACALLEAGSEAQKASYLPRISCGEITITLAIEESNRHNPDLLSTALTAQNGGYELNGVKKFVIDAHTCDQIVVVCKGADGKQKLVVVDSARDGVRIEREIMMDSRNYGEIEFNKVKISAEEVLGNASEKSIERILDIGRICLSAELYGTAIEAFERSIAYLKERKQFGVELATFQGLQHRSADMYCQLEMCNSAVLDALSAIDDGEKDLRLKASIAKSKMSQVAQLVTNEAVQFYGGIGMTDEEEIGFFLKRARVATALLGDHNFHLNRFATLSGY
jgi:acyl-CoA dehydrogenase